MDSEPDSRRARTTLLEENEDIIEDLICLSEQYILRSVVSL